MFIDMNELQTVNDIINTAVENSSYTTVIISCSVFIIYTIINKVVEIYKTKSRNKPMIEMASAVKQVSENVVKLNQVLDKTFKDAEIKEANKINSIITAAFNSFKSEVLTRCIDIIVHNNIQTNKDSITQSVYKTVSTEYYKVYSIFSAYEHDKVNIATRLKEEWIDAITKECLQIIYNNQDATDRIRQINNKLTINTEEYSIYINNKVFNH